MKWHSSTIMVLWFLAYIVTSVFSNDLGMLWLVSGLFWIFIREMEREDG